MIVRGLAFGLAVVASAVCAGCTGRPSGDSADADAGSIRAAPESARREWFIDVAADAGSTS